MAHWDECVIFLLAKAYQRAYGLFKKRLQAYGLTPIQHLILEVLWFEDGPAAGEIGKRLSLDAATLSGVLDRLVDGGWVVKEIDRDDKRVVRVNLTEKANNQRLALVGEREQANEEVLTGLNIEEKIVLKRLLRDLRGPG